MENEGFSSKARASLSVSLVLENNKATRYSSSISNSNT